MLQGESRDILHLHLAQTRSLHHASISGDSFACEFLTDNTDETVLLVNWRIAEFIVIGTPMDKPDLAMFPGHLAVFDRTPDRSRRLPQNQVRIYRIASFDHLWHAVSEFTFANPIHLAQIASVAIDVPVSPLKGFSPLCYARISVAESLIHDAAYELVVAADTLVASQRAPLSFWSRLRGQNPGPKTSPEQSVTTVSGYLIGLSPSSPAVPQLKSVFRHVDFVRYATGRYGLSWKDPHWNVQSLIHAPEDVPPHELTLPGKMLSSPVQMARTDALMV
ncbi:hypothetical protein B0H17DRAFT_1086772 [Mycena rosella]|uniref:Uncharacterized protein n=1 Tax=Mycena rosella TaxID=1033263 RepID=A0AAD7CYD9_MYCRO|nr:hypothetical protein B0H17DRAFT_1086772 [Mycena rosella]